jgi:hypothetical protein
MTENPWLMAYGAREWDFRRGQPRRRWRLFFKCI